MNTLKAEVRHIRSVENLNIVKFGFHDVALCIMSLELNQNIKIGSIVKLAAKSTNIAIAKSFSGDISYSNQLEARILNIDNGELLSSVTLDVYGTILEAVITRESCQKMNLLAGDAVTALIKANDFSILEVLND